jgi:three-Cys-motif partner protein
MKNSHTSYWKEYTNLQFVKHKLIKEYLNGWFPKLGSWCGKILYVDTHAGRGKHVSGEEGSPLVALRTFLEHSWRDQILTRCEVRFMFIELDKTNVAHLQEEIQKLGKLPDKVAYNIYTADAFGLLSGLADEFEKSGRHLAPCFLFVDPYGFSVPCEVLRKIKAHSRSELLLTLIWRELDMAMQQRNPTPALKATIDSVYGGKEWEVIKSIGDFDARGEAAIQKTRYFLLHLTDHEDGRDLMKQVVWKCCPEDGYFARKTDNPRQQYLIKPEPNLDSLRSWLFNNLRQKNCTWKELKESLLEEIWLNKHLWQIIRELREKGDIEATNFSGRFSQKANPTFKLGRPRDS